MADVTLSAAAQAELEKACAHYRLTSARVADEFLDEVLDATRKIGYAPEQWPLYEDDHRYRLFVLDRHSYVIYYRIEDDLTVRVVAVAQSARQLGYWRGR